MEDEEGGRDCGWSRAITIMKIKMRRLNFDQSIWRRQQHYTCTYTYGKDLRLYI